MIGPVSDKNRIQKNPSQPREKGKLIESYRVEQGGQECFYTTGWRRAYSKKKIPSEMDVAPRYSLLTLFTLFDSVQTAQTA